MEFYQLEAFVAVAAHRSFSRAAEQLYLSQPTVSAHVKSLENELNNLLFDRGKNELLLTTAGETLLRYAKDMLDLRMHVLTELSDKDQIGEEVVTISASSVPCQYLLPQAIAEFKKAYPGVTVNLHQDNSRTVCENIFNYRYSLGIVGEKIQLPRLTFEPLASDELVAAVPQKPEYQDLLNKKTIPLQELHEYPLLLRERGSGTRSLFEHALQQAGETIEQFSYQVFANQETIKQAIRRGLGVSVLSRYVVEDYHEFGVLALRPLEGMSLIREFCLVTYEKRVQTPAARALIQFLRLYFRKE